MLRRFGARRACAAHLETERRHLRTHLLQQLALRRFDGQHAAFLLFGRLLANLAVQPHLHLARVLHHVVKRLGRRNSGAPAVSAAAQAQVTR